MTASQGRTNRCPAKLPGFLDGRCVEDEGHPGPHNAEGSHAATWHREPASDPKCTNCGYPFAGEHDPKSGHCHHGGTMEDATQFEPAPSVENSELRGDLKLTSKEYAASLEAEISRLRADQLTPEEAKHYDAETVKRDTIGKSSG